MNKKKINKNRPPSQSFAQGLVRGRLEITRSGMGYVIVEKDGSDVMVKPGDFNTALNGDQVRVKVTKQNPRTGKREGKISEVITRRQTEFIGFLQLSTNHAFFIPDSDKPMPDLFIPLSATMGAKHKDRVVARLVKWEREDKKPVGEIISILQPEDRNDAAMKELIAQNGFPLVFPDEVLEEAARLPEQIPAAELERRKDCRSLLTFTIDPVDARDFDDALSIRTLPDGWWEIGVHIADVSHYIQPETSLDEEAYRRATSVYLPDRVNPMLPEVISNELCSLRPHEDKLCFSAIFEINNRSEVRSCWLGRTVIHSDHRFTYEDVQTIIEQEAGLHHKEILVLHQLAQKFRKKRFAKGAIRFSSQEIRFRLDPKGKPIGVIIKESKESHQLIEEFMLLANKYVAEKVSKVKVNNKPVPFPYRIHDQPDKEKLAPFMVFAKKYGHTFNVSTPAAIAASFNQMLQDVEGKPEQHVLEQLGIRTMSKAVYASDNIGHYGLAFDLYCHFTSPIRRYPDILVHRILQQVLEDNIKPDKKMDEKCLQCSERERAAMECERAGNKYKQVEFMQDHLGEVLEGVICGVASFGFWVETIDYKCEGLVSILSLSDYDDFRLMETDFCLTGRRSGRVFRMGDRVTIRVVAANLDKRQLDYEWVMQENSKKEPKKTKH
ncbi:MAG: ribonuclease R [Bacteroidota bacterium]